MNELQPALVVVHGIGLQRPGATLTQAAAGLLSVCPGATLHTMDGDSIAPAAIEARGLQRACIRQGALTLRLFEVHWADLLPDEPVAGSFTKFELDEITWFPLLNWRAGLLPRAEYAGWLVYARTLQLWLLQVTMTHALDVLKSVSNVRETALDRTAADVWHYVHALAGDPSAPPALREAAERILDRAETTCLEAAAGGPLHLVGHSLGSVVAYHVMTRRLPPDAVTHLVTLGSPLEKVRFIWAALFPSTDRLPCIWSNYFTPSDPVSGSLTRFAAAADRPIRNIRRWGLGGYGLAHVGYFRDTRVACDIARGMGAEADPQADAPRSGWLWRRIVDVVVPGGILLLIGVGLSAAVVVFGAAIWLTGAFMGLLARAWSPEAGALVERGWWVFWGSTLPVLWIVFTTQGGYRSAATRHARYWHSSSATQ